MNSNLSIKGAQWEPRLRAALFSDVEKIIERIACDPLVARIIVARGANPINAGSWLAPKVRDLMTDPADFADMKNAIDRIVMAIESGERVAVFGDYDVDGACSTALMIRYLEMVGANAPLFYIPDRVFEGYGLNSGAISHLADQGVHVLVSVDCGTTAHAELAHAHSLGLDAIVLDHHEPDAVLPPGLVVNPKRKDDLSGEESLCAAGVVFLLLVGVNRELRERGRFSSDAIPEPNLLSLVHLVALATIADVAPLTPLNRAFVRTGLQLLDSTPGPGLTKLMAISEAKAPTTSTTIGFQLAPRLNAGGRLGESSLATMLLLTDNPEHAEDYARRLDALNTERRALEQQAVSAAMAAIEEDAKTKGLGPAIFAIGENWNPGVAGLIAARLAEAYQRPAFAITFHGEVGVGSARSGGAADIGLVVKEAAAAGIIDRGGGHAAAAGLSLTRAQYQDFVDFVEAALDAQRDELLGPSVFYHDGELVASSAGALMNMIGQMDAAGPYGQANPEPTFVLEDVAIRDIKVVGGAHLKITAKPNNLPIAIAAMSFRSVDTNLGRFLQACAAKKTPVRLLVSVEINEFRGERTPQARIIDAALTEYSSAILI